MTVIGWAWIVIGAGLASSSGAISLALIGSAIDGEPEATPRWFPLLAVAQLALAALAVASGIGLLRARAWSRTVLEALSWLLLASVLAVEVAWFFLWLAPGRWPAPTALSLMGAISACVMIGLFHALPLGIMLKYLRSGKVKAAMTPRRSSHVGAV